MNTDIQKLQNIANALYEQRTLSDIYASEDEVANIGSAAAEPMVYRVPASKFVSATRGIVKDQIKDIIKNDLDTIAEDGIERVLGPQMGPLSWFPETGLRDFDLADAEEAAINFIGYEVLQALDPELVDLLESETPFTLIIDNEDGEDIRLSSNDIAY